jgi:hypothetical protein
MATANDESDVGRKGKWRHRLVSILPPWFRPTANTKKRRALASLLLAASFTISRPVGALPSENDAATTEELRASSSGIVPRETVQLTSTSFNGDTQLATIPVSSKKGTFWTKRRVIMLAAGGGTVLGLSLVPPVSDDEDEMNEKSAPTVSELQVQPLPSSISKEAFRELEQLFGGEKTTKASETNDAEKSVRSSVPLIEEDVRVISDPSADIVEKESSKPKGIKAVKKVTPIIQEDLQENKVEKDATMDHGKVSEKKKEATEQQLRAQAQVIEKPTKETASVGFTQENEGSKGFTDELIFKNKDELSSGEPVKEDDFKKTAEEASLLKKEEATRRALLEERLKEEAKRLEEETKLRKVKEEEAAQRALLEERVKQEFLLTQVKKNEQVSLEKIEDADTMQVENAMPEEEKIPEIDIPKPVSKEEFAANEAESGTTTEDMSSTIETTVRYRRQPLSPDEEAELQKKYSALPLKERAYRILVDLGMIDSSPE